MSEIQQSASSGPLRRFECRIRSRQNPQDLDVTFVNAPDKETALERLQRDGSLVVSIREMHEFNKGAAAANVRKQLGFKFSFKDGDKRRRYIPFAKPVTTRELIFFAVQLSTLLGAGVALVRALDILERGTANIYFAGVIKKLAKSVSEGRALSDTLAEYPRVFPWLWRSLVAVGEATGNLPAVLKEVSQYQESSERIKGKVISALTYPAILVVIASGAVTFLMIMIVPRFQSIFAAQGAKLPALTQAVLLISVILKNYLWLVAIFVGIIVALVKSYMATPIGKVDIARRFLQIPVLGQLFLELAVVRFCRGLATLLNSGIPLLKGLETAGVLSGNAYIEKQIDRTREAVSQGHGLGVQLEANRVFPVFMTQLVSVGEETGEIYSFLKLLADYYEERVNQFLGRLATVIEPVMLVTMAFIIGVIVIAMFLPIIELSSGTGL